MSSSYTYIHVDNVRAGENIIYACISVDVFGVYRTTPPIFFLSLCVFVSPETSGKKTPHWKIQNEPFVLVLGKVAAF